MNTAAKKLNEALGDAVRFLSPAGKRMYFPYAGILGQGGEAKQCAINATLGMAFEEDGSPLVLKAFAKTLTVGTKAFLYSNSFGMPAMRDCWRELELKKNPSLKGKKFSRPVATHALTHGIRIAAELFAGAGDELVLPDLYWDNYELIFQEAVGCKVRTFNMFKKAGGSRKVKGKGQGQEWRFDADAMKAALLAPGEKKILILNFPNNPTGYTATVEDAKNIVSAVRAAAAKGKRVVVLLDDAYFGLVYEKGIHAESLFAEFSDLHRNVLAVKLDGTTKEDYVWGLRLGYITFAFKGATDAQLKALEDKAAGNVRSCISSVTSIGQHMALAAYADPGYAAQKREKYETLKARYLEIRKIFREHPAYAESFEPMPCNSGYFICVKPVGVPAEKVRRRLIEGYSTGTIVLSGLIRIAFSTTPKQKLGTLFANIDAAVRDLKS